MKILVVSNFFPPHQIGGYELLCQEVTDALVERGHEVRILTSSYGSQSGGFRDESNEGVYRVLTLESDLDYYRIKDAWTYNRKREKNINNLRGLVAQYQPDIIFIWGMWSLTKLLAAESERLLGTKVAYYLANPWPIQPNRHVAYWDHPANSLIGKVVKCLLRFPIRGILKEEWKQYNLLFEHAPCCSKALRDQIKAAGVQLQDSPVIYEGIKLERYLKYGNSRTFSEFQLSLLYVGILAPHKGVHTAIDALSRLSLDVRTKLRFTILGAGHPEYITRLHDMVSENGLGEMVEFKKPIPREALPEFLGRFHVLLLPSIWEEPLALIMQEGLASGLVVVGSTTGGTKEIIRDGVNGVLFPPDDASALARKIEALLHNPSMCISLSEYGRRIAIEMFDIDRMVYDLELYLLKAVNEDTFSN